MPEHLDDSLKPAIGYIRVSMLREEAISPELQRTAIQDWARRTGHRIVDWVEDLDKTGRNFKRKIMQAIERVEGTDVKRIAVWKYSRFGRNRTGIELNLARIEQAGGQLLSATEEIDATTATGWFQRDVIFSVATFESKRAGEQWMETHQWRRDHGLPAMGKPRFGYIWYPRKRFRPDGTVVLQEERYEPDPETSKVVEDLYQRYVTGESYRSLALWLNDEGHRTVRSDLWSSKALRRYMDSGFPAGYLRFHLKTCPLGGAPHDCAQYELVRHPTLHHPQIISDDLWRQYQSRRDFTRTAAPRARSASYPLTGLVRCGACQGATRRWVDSRGHSRYSCLGRAEKGHHACPGSSTGTAIIEAAIKDVLAKFSDRIGEAADRAEVGLPGQRSRDSKDRRRAQLEEAVAKLERSIARHMRVYAMSEEDDPSGDLEKEYLATLRELRAEKAAAAGELSKLRVENEGDSGEAWQAETCVVAKGLLDEWETLPPGRINLLLRKVIDRVVLRPRGDAVEIYLVRASEPYVWTFEGSGRPMSKYAAVVEALKEPGVTVRQVAERLSAEGLAVTEGYVRVCRRRARARVEAGASDQGRIYVVN